MLRHMLPVLSERLATLVARFDGPRRLTRLRWSVARHVPARLALGAVLAFGALAAVRSEQHAAVRARDRWGRTTSVLVARTDVAAGALLTPDVVEQRLLPAALVPLGALTELAAGAAAIDELAEGEVVLAHHTTSGSGLAARLAPGTAGVGVPVAALSFVPRVGDFVTLVSTADEVGLGGAGTPLEPTDGEVVAVDDSAVLVAVPVGVAPALGQLSVNGRIGLLLRRAPGQ